ncbi:hypothetical protein [Flexivirga oryzae]|uniref:Uncharacterized protein n=1 Tax=Flexivirga oryzae TaxID=1794944 RepID=A0A839N9R8_9MICO|nr:hypothetical protein [Flexivirga oryzae]MBB2894500.1 hypothetical protein [Flexivirga oryzae]
MGNIQMTQPCDEHVAMTSALPMLTSVHVAAARGSVQGTGVFAAGSAIDVIMRERAVDGISVADLGAECDVQTYNSKFAGGVRCSVFKSPPV